ncbi:hypothetical protein L3Q82_014479 [Scortum barcoo]|uniref:Uncharacterized protein n=1 Tax=Scortum barcoo TaxID=214431 RepID=A0ACB8VXL0_9TELE|nr:hypothetical protein L3Q82_014479 [Scortum barcoo]
MPGRGDCKQACRQESAPRRERGVTERGAHFIYAALFARFQLQTGKPRPPGPHSSSSPAPVIKPIHEPVEDVWFALYKSTVLREWKCDASIVHLFQSWRREPLSPVCNYSNAHTNTNASTSVSHIPAQTKHVRPSNRSQEKLQKKPLWEKEET